MIVSSSSPIQSSSEGEDPPNSCGYAVAEGRVASKRPLHDSLRPVYSTIPSNVRQVSLSPLSSSSSSSLLGFVEALRSSFFFFLFSFAFLRDGWTLISCPRPDSSLPRCRDVTAALFLNLFCLACLSASQLEHFLSFLSSSFVVRSFVACWPRKQQRIDVDSCKSLSFFLYLSRSCISTQFFACVFFLHLCYILFFSPSRCCYARFLRHAAAFNPHRCVELVCVRV